MIVRLAYPVASGSTRWRTVFVKETLPGDREAAKYSSLAAHGVPVPQVLAAVLSSGGGEVIVLEFLPRIGVDFTSATEVMALLALVAAWNAVPVEGEPDRTTWALPPGHDERRFSSLVQEALDALRSSHPSVRPCAWFQAYEAARDAAASMPVALNHGELYFQHVGWSVGGGRRALVPVDLATMGVRPRFGDIANVLGPLAAEAGRRELDVFADYLGFLAPSVGRVPNLAAAYREVRQIRVVGHVEALPWLLRSAGRSGAGRARLHRHVAAIGRDMAALGVAGG